MNRSASRREFLQASAAAGVGFWVGGSALAVEGKSANDKINFACIGVGGKGDSDTQQAGNHGNIVALCDIDDNNLGKMAARFPKAKKYNDFRKMLEEMDKEIDAVTVSTADHTHAPASIMAMRMKKHVYCQKPLTHTVYEARLMRETAAKMNVCSQMGNQGTAESGLRRAVEIVQAGALGKITEAHVWTNRPIWPQAPKVTARPTGKFDVPAHVHWDLFLGPAPERPYAPGYHPFAWRGWWDFGTGALGDMGCHTANMAFMALKLGYPSTIVAECGDLNPETCPSWAHVTYEFPARDENYLGACKVHWYEGKKDDKRVLPSQELLSKVLKPGEKLSDSGSLIVGEKGILFSPNDYGAAYRLMPENHFVDYKGPAETLPRNGRGDDGMKAEWVRAMRENNPSIAMSNFAYSGMLTEFILLGNVAIRAAKKIDWDGPHLKAVGCPEADQYIKGEYRKGWEL